MPQIRLEPALATTVVKSFPSNHPGIPQSKAWILPHNASLLTGKWDSATHQISHLFVGTPQRPQISPTTLDRPGEPLLPHLAVELRAHGLPKSLPNPADGSPKSWRLSADNKSGRIVSKVLALRRSHTDNCCLLRDTSPGFGLRKEAAKRAIPVRAAQLRWRWGQMSSFGYTS